MKVVNISEAKNNLSRYIEYVRRGGRIRILDRDTAVADLVPVAPEIASTPDAGEDERTLASLERRGLARRGRPGRLPRELLRPGPADAGAGVAAALLTERRGSR